MPPALRRAQILERIQRDGGVSIAELARDHDVSAVTVHRDLTELAREGLVERVHGGARAVANAVLGTAPPPTAWKQRATHAEAAKAAIAAHALRYIDTGATIFVDASSTALALARRLMHQPPNELTLVTNSPAIACEARAEAIHVVVTPGELDQHMRMIAGRWTVEFIGELSFAVAFVSAAGVTLEQGLTTARRAVADVTHAARANALRTIALMDATKFQRRSLLSIAAAQDFDAIVTDDGLDEDVAAEFRAAGVRLEIANPQEGV